jgi:glycosyltransferase involved in cell wall biosynthesis
VRIVLWHGYLLGGTGSNVYTRALAREWSRAGHEVTVVCQERAPADFDLGGARIVVPDLPGGLLPVFVLDDYPGLEARLLQDFGAAERRRYVAANLAALRQLPAPELLFANHVLMGGAVAAAAGGRYRVKAHGSELEYSIRGRPSLQALARSSLRHAEATIVGSEHVRGVLAEVVGPLEGVVCIPPGVDVEEFGPRPPAVALANLRAEARADPPNPGNRNERLPDEENAERLGRFLEDERPTIVYFGKLIANKGVQLLLEALGSLEARAVIVGFGDFRGALEKLAAALAPGRVLFTGPLEHRHLVQLLPLAEVAVVPSIFPEAFGMVAVEAAASGCPPLVARHSGLAEVAAGLERYYPAHLRHLAGFAPGDAADLRARLAELLALPGADRAALRSGARAAAEGRWSWASVAARLLEPVVA